MFGSHLSIAGSMVNALEEGSRLGLSCVQVFTKNQQQWSVKPLDEGTIAAWTDRVRALGWDAGGPDGRGGNTSHASYLINLASPDDGLWRKSIDLMTEEIERCEQLGIPYLVQHPGAATGSTREEGIARIGAACGELFRRTRGYATVLCFEATAGAGTHLGGRFEELAAIRGGALREGCEPARVAYCLDTCHLHAAGYDLSTRASAAGVLDEFDRVCGLGLVKVLHVNDSKGKLGSHLDRHEHIGEGWVGGGATPHSGAGTFSAARLRESGFAAVVNHPAFANVPMILETPKGEAPDGRAWDTINLARLRWLAQGAPEGAQGLAASGPPPTKPRTRAKRAGAKDEAAKEPPAGRRAASRASGAGRGGRGTGRGS